MNIHYTISIVNANMKDISSRDITTKRGPGRRICNILNLRKIREENGVSKVVYSAHVTKPTLQLEEIVNKILKSKIILI